MRGKRHKPEEIVAKLRQVDVLVSQGQKIGEAVRAISGRGLAESCGLHSRNCRLSDALPRGGTRSGKGLQKLL
jgi:hypothetical protein